MLEEALQKRGRVYVEEVLAGRNILCRPNRARSASLDAVGDIEKAQRCFESARRKRRARTSGGWGCWSVESTRGSSMWCWKNPRTAALTDLRGCVVIGALVYARLARGDEAASMLKKARGIFGRFWPHIGAM